MQRLGAQSIEEAIYMWAKMEPRERMELPHTRVSTTHKVTIYGEHGDAPLYITAGRYPNGEVGELFVNMGKQGSTLRGALDSWARMVSVALQWGVPMGEIIRKFQGVAFEPSGATSNKAIPRCTSVVDYTVQWLKLEAARLANQRQKGRSDGSVHG